MAMLCIRRNFLFSILYMLTLLVTSVAYTDCETDNDCNNSWHYCSKEYGKCLPCSKCSQGDNPLQRCLDGGVPDGYLCACNNYHCSLPTPCPPLPSPTATATATATESGNTTGSLSTLTPFPESPSPPPNKVSTSEISTLHLILVVVVPSLCLLAFVFCIVYFCRTNCRNKKTTTYIDGHRNGRTQEDTDRHSQNQHFALQPLSPPQQQVLKPLLRSPLELESTALESTADTDLRDIYEHLSSPAQPVRLPPELSTQTAENVQPNARPETVWTNKTGSEVSDDEVKLCTKTVSDLLEDEDAMHTLKIRLDPYDDKWRFIGSKIANLNIFELNYIQSQSNKISNYSPIKVVMEKIQSLQLELKLVQLVKILQHHRKNYIVQQIYQFHNDCPACHIYYRPNQIPTSHTNM